MRPPQPSAVGEAKQAGQLGRPPRHSALGIAAVVAAVVPVARTIRTRASVARVVLPKARTVVGTVGPGQLGDRQGARWNDHPVPLGLREVRGVRGRGRAGLLGLRPVELGHEVLWAARALPRALPVHLLQRLRQRQGVVVGQVRDPIEASVRVGLARDPALHAARAALALPQRRGPPHHGLGGTEARRGEEHCDDDKACHAGAGRRVG